MAESKSTSKTTAAKAGDSGEAEVQAKVDAAEERGFFGEAVDETPRENYTLNGVTSGKPTPETSDR